MNRFIFLRIAISSFIWTSVARQAAGEFNAFKWKRLLLLAIVESSRPDILVFEMSNSLRLGNFFKRLANLDGLVTS